MKVFISHQSTNSLVAKRVAGRLKNIHGIDSYLDVVDPFLGGNGEDLASHIRSEMGNCTQLLAVVSGATRLSQWVPWEVGVATEKDFPLATYSDGISAPPEFLRSWPYLRSDADLDHYASASKSAEHTFSYRRSLNFSERYSRHDATQHFFRTLRANLKQ